MRSSAVARRRTHRRLVLVAADPHLATVDDIGELLLVHGATPESTWEALDRVERLHLDPTVLWEWTMAYDGIELARLLSSEMPDYLVDSALVDGIVIHRELSRMQLE